MLVVDTSGLLAFFDASDAQHAAVDQVIAEDPGPFVVSPYIIAELDYLLATKRSVREQLAALQELSGGAWELAHLGPEDLASASEVLQRYEDQEIGIADASLVVLAERHKTNRILTLDRRRLRVLRTLDGRAFKLLPDDR